MFEYLFGLVIIGLVTVVVFYCLNRWYFPRMRVEKVVQHVKLQVQKIQENDSVVKLESDIADLKFTLNGTDYLIKVVKGSLCNNIVITNKTTWIQTERTGALDIKNRIKTIEPFLLDQSQNDTGDSVEKIVLIYPNAKNILRYINENEMVFVTKETEVFGVRVVRFNELEAYIEAL